jgi:Smr domain-containing protein
MRDDRVGLNGLKQAFDEARFGPQRTLNLRESLPTADQARMRAEAWLRQAQVARAGEVLIITGRGRGSDAGVSVVREAVNALLHVLRRRGVVREFREHTAGSFVVTPAPISELWEAPRRKRDRGPQEPPNQSASLQGLDDDTRALLRNLAERALEGLGVKDTAEFIEGEMARQFSAIAASIGGERDDDIALREAIRSALEQHE